MRATRKNLINEWLLNEKLMTYFEFWDYIKFFIKNENWQRFQNMWHEFSKKDLDGAYEKYCNDTSCINYHKLQRIVENEEIYLFKKVWTFGTKYSFTCYCYFLNKRRLEKRIFRKIKKSEKYSIKINSEWREIIMPNFESVWVI